MEVCEDKMYSFTPYRIPNQQQYLKRLTTSKISAPPNWNKCFPLRKRKKNKKQTNKDHIGKFQLNTALARINPGRGAYIKRLKQQSHTFHTSGESHCSVRTRHVTKHTRCHGLDPDQRRVVGGSAGTELAAWRPRPPAGPHAALGLPRGDIQRHFI